MTKSTRYPTAKSIEISRIRSLLWEQLGATAGDSKEVPSVENDRVTRFWVEEAYQVMEGGKVTLTRAT